MSRARNRIAAAAAAALIGMILVAVPASRADTYVGGGTVVYKQSGQPPEQDKGTLACLNGTGIAVGGGCLPMTEGGYVHVTDAASGDRVAFQVCIDNDGDGVCTDGVKDPGGQQPCHDEIFFSHDDQGNFHNPIGPLPGRTPGCPDAPWNGWVVFLCQGVHTPADGTGGTPHSHATTVGTIAAESLGTPSGFGDFCGGAGRAVVSKPYEVLG